MPTIHEVENALYALAPRELAQSWDNVGLLVGSPVQEVRRVLTALDITAAVVDEAARLGAELIVAHHPVMNCNWHPVQTLRDDNPQGQILFQLVKGGIGAICMHTNLDAAKGGVNDALAEAIGLEEVSCVEENGIERVGNLPQTVTLLDFLARVQEGLHPNGIRYVDSGKPICRVAVGGGACGSFFTRAVALGCDALVTADVKYDQFLDAKALGLSLIDAGHFPTEDVVCPVLVRYLEEYFPDLKVYRSEVHREVVQYFPTM